MKVYKILKPLYILLLLVGLFLIAPVTLARENVTNWYIQDFNSNIIVNKDSTLDITEKITADCGTAINKHGIFRILPERIKIEGHGTVKTPVQLISITDFNGQAIKYSESRNFFDGTITWKIGDPNKTVQGVNYYEIHYLVKNAIRFSNANFDELYWNLNGNFWDIETDKFQASLIFPAEVNQANATVDYYTGYLGDKGKDLASYHWSSPNVLEFTSTKTLLAKQGITASVIFPKNIFTPYQFGWLDTYGQYFFLPLPLIIFFICLNLWRKYGKDPRVDKTVIAEYDVPGKLTPLELGMLETQGTFKNTFITAEIINLAVKGLITIKELSEEGMIFKHKDYVLTKQTNPDAEKMLSRAESYILARIFTEGRTVVLSTLKNNFYKDLSKIRNSARRALITKGLIVAAGFYYRAAFMVVGAILMASAFFLIVFSLYSLAAVFFSGLIIFIFGLLMPKRTPAGAELNWQIKGFKLFMQTVDKYRAEFYERENIFEKFLPYAIVFGITGLWIRKMKEIYGADFYTTYAPVWYVGSLASFDADSFNSAISSLSSSIAANTSSPSGSGGAGGAGGGGGGGGGGGW